MKITKYALTAALVLIAHVAPSAARADTLTTFYVSGTFDGGYTLTGFGFILPPSTLVIDVTDGDVMSASLYIISPGGNLIGGNPPSPEGGAFTINTGIQQGELFADIYYVPTLAPSGSSLGLYIPVSSPLGTLASGLVGYTGGPLCSEDYACGPFANSPTTYTPI